MRLVKFFFRCSNVKDWAAVTLFLVHIERYLAGIWINLLRTKIFEPASSRCPWVVRESQSDVRDLRWLHGHARMNRECVRYTWQAKQIILYYAGSGIVPRRVPFDYSSSDVGNVTRSRKLHCLLCRKLKTIYTTFHCITMQETPSRCKFINSSPWSSCIHTTC